MRDFFFQALMVQPPVICGRRLRPFSLAHEYILKRIGSPYVCGGAVTRADVMAAIRGLAESPAAEDRVIRHAVAMAIAGAASPGDLDALSTHPLPDVRLVTCVALRRLRDERLAAHIERLGLGARVNQRAGTLSGGWKQRLALACATAHHPDLVFLDEPTSGLDPIGAADFDELIGTLQKTLGLTVFMVTHDLDSLYSICDRVAALADGKVIAAGPLESLLVSPHPWLQAYFHGVRGGRMTGVTGPATDRSRGA
jgi:ABC-type sugar transport system ATPase subunit